MRSYLRRVAVLFLLLYVPLAGVAALAFVILHYRFSVATPLWGPELFTQLIRLGEGAVAILITAALIAIRKPKKKSGEGSGKADSSERKTRRTSNLNSHTAGAV